MDDIRTRALKVCRAICSEEPALSFKTCRLTNYAPRNFFLPNLPDPRCFLGVPSFTPVLHFMAVSALTHLSIKYVVVGQHKSAQM